MKKEFCREDFIEMTDEDVCILVARAMITCREELIMASQQFKTNSPSWSSTKSTEIGMLVSEVYVRGIYREYFEKVLRIYSMYI